MMVYTCENTDCRFIFERYGEPDRCPDCGKPRIRPATEAEMLEFRKRISSDPH